MIVEREGKGKEGEASERRKKDMKKGNEKKMWRNRVNKKRLHIKVEKLHKKHRISWKILAL